MRPLSMNGLASAIQIYTCCLDCTNQKIIKNTGSNSMTTADPSKRTETVGEYNNVPEDITYYVKNSRMAQQPEVTLWDFIEKRPDLEYIKFCEGSDVLIHDCQYTPEEINEREGWGHSDYESVVDLAHKAEVKRLILFHHDPSRKDPEVSTIQKNCRGLAKKKNSSLVIDAAKEDSEFDL